MSKVIWSLGKLGNDHVLITFKPIRLTMSKQMRGSSYVHQADKVIQIFIGNHVLD